MAVRAVLLGDLQRVLSVARRRYGYLLTADHKRQTQVRPLVISASLLSFYSRLYGWLSIDVCVFFIRMAARQRSSRASRCFERAYSAARVRPCPSLSHYTGYCMLNDLCVFMQPIDLAELNPAIVLRPFLDLIRHEMTSSTLTGAALEAVRSFLMTWPWPQVTDTNAIADAVSDVVDAVGQCRFQETSAESDAHVIVLVVGVLHAVLTSHAAPFLSDHSMWQLVESLYALSRASRSDVR